MKFMQSVKTHTDELLQLIVNVKLISI